MSRPTETYLRFAVRHPFEVGGPVGLFEIAGRYENEQKVPKYIHDALVDTLKWFNANLKQPDRVNRTKSKGYYRREAKGIFWFKSSATSHISKIRELALLLKDLGHTIDELHTKRPGYVVYEDEYQIVAEPYSETENN